ncbi:MAG: HNH endonuclease [Thermoleophilia bacterium]
MTISEGQANSTDPEFFRGKVESLIRNFEAELHSDSLRSKVLALVPIFHSLRDLGKALLPPGKDTSSARDRILFYFRKYPKSVIDGDELLVVSGIQEYARRIRELRVQFGWSIASGVTIKEISQEEAGDIPEELRKMKPSEYVLLEIDQDREAAHRWNVANTIRRKKGSVHDKVLEYLRENVGQIVTGEELRYVAGNKTEWARRVRELRTEFGWPIATKSTGRPDLPVGAYTLEADRQSPVHDRNIPDNVRREVLRSDRYRCTECDWSHEEWNPSDPRHLELHHIKHHARGGKNVKENLRTLCTLCHDQIHKKEK